MKKYFKLLLTILSVGLSSICLFTKCFAADPPQRVLRLTDVGRECLFRTWFKKAARDCQYDYDRNFTIKTERQINRMAFKTVPQFLSMLKKISCEMVDIHKKGVCRNFAFRVKKELDTWGIENKLMILRRKTDTEAHMANYYISPVTKKPMVADLSREVTYKKDPAYIPEAVLFSAIPLGAYLYVMKYDLDDFRLIDIENGDLTYWLNLIGFVNN